MLFGVPIAPIPFIVLISCSANVSFADGTLDGSGVSPLGIKPEQMTQEVWDYIFLQDVPVCS